MELCAITKWHHHPSPLPVLPSDVRAYGCVAAINELEPQRLPEVGVTFGARTTTTTTTAIPPKPGSVRTVLLFWLSVYIHIAATLP